MPHMVIVVDGRQGTVRARREDRRASQPAPSMAIRNLTDFVSMLMEDAILVAIGVGFEPGDTIEVIHDY